MTTKLTVNKLKVDLMGILQTQSVTFKTEAMEDEIFRQLKLIPGVSWETDTYGNIYVTKGKNTPYPAYVCHIDTVHPLKEDFRVLRDVRDHGTFYYAVSSDTEINKTNEFVPKLDKQVGVGGDDKCGIIACIELLHRLKNIKCVFFLDEEQGCKGSEAGNLNFFKDCRYAIQVDRMNGGDIITNGRGVPLCSKKFEEFLNALGKNFGYKSTDGKGTDVVKLKERGLGISAVNLSAGYYNPHGKQEYINEEELMNAIQFCLAIANIKTVFEHIYKPIVTPAKIFHQQNLPNVNQQDKFCLECKNKLFPSEEYSRLCNTCKNKIYEDIVDPTLKVADDGKTTLVISIVSEESISSLLPIHLQKQLPSKDCLICGADLVQETHKDRGYCESCVTCFDCNSKITSSEGLAGNYCEKCLANLDAATGATRSRVNESAMEEKACLGCQAQLYTDEEIKNGACPICAAQWRGYDRLSDE